MLRGKAESIDTLINQFLRAEGLETPLQEYRIIQSWYKIAGEAISKYTGDIFIRNGILNVQIKSPALRQNLMMSRTLLAQRLNQQVGGQIITNIVFY